MQFLVTSDILGKNIQGLSKMMNGKASLAILDHCLFEVDGNVLQVIASDGENMMRTTTELMESDLTPGESVRFCVHSRVLGDFLKNIPTQPLTITMENKTEITINYMNGHVSFPCVSDDEYPTFDILTGDTETAILPSTAMLEDIRPLGTVLDDHSKGSRSTINRTNHRYRLQDYLEIGSQK